MLREQGIVTEEAAAQKAAVKLIQDEINVGNVAGGQDKFVESPSMIDWACKDALPVSCDHDNYIKTRTISGMCNNLKNPLKGASSTKQPRLLPCKYADGHQEPRGGWASSRNQCCTGKATAAKTRGDTCDTEPDALLPNPRTVRKHFHTTDNIEDDKSTLLFTLFGQFLDHDISLTPETGVPDCCGILNDNDCFAMKEPYENECKSAYVCTAEDRSEDLPFPRNLFKENKGGDDARDCFKFARSLQFCHSDISKKPRQQLNAISSFVDASNVYGAEINLHMRLREPGTPFLRVADEDNAFGILPDINGTHALAGDKRASEVPGLAAMHTIFLREHNRIAMGLTALLDDNGGAADDVEYIFEKSREILIAEMQNIVYGEYLTLLIGEDGMNDKQYHLKLNQREPYRPFVDPGATNEFSTVAFRFGHSMIAGKILKLDVNTCQEKDSYMLRETFFNMTEYLTDNGLGLEEILNGQMNQPSLACDAFIDTDVADHLFLNNNKFDGDDLGARNIQRGRDHGIPGYNDYRDLCGMPKVCDWETVPDEIKASDWEKLSEIYDHPSDIDLFTAGMAEIPHGGGIVGRTFECIIAKQFKKLKDGDRFFFNRKPAEEETIQEFFTDDQVEHIKTRNLRDIICDNTLIKDVPKHVFLKNSPKEPCEELSTLDLNKFV